jgi:alpha-methylacyl-CoA racemase
MGPLSGKTIIEFAGLGPAPYAGMMLADMGAEVIRVERPGGQWLTAGGDPKYDVHNRGKSSICINMKSEEGIACAKKLISSADALIEGYRPGVMEKLGLGPDECLKINPKLVYGRMTGWGQTGPLAQTAGHDINRGFACYWPEGTEADDSAQPSWRLWRWRHDVSLRTGLRAFGGAKFRAGAGY